MSYAVPIAVILVSVLIAGGLDLWTFRIPNLLTIPLIITGLFYHTMMSQLTGLTGSVCGLLIGTLPYLWLCLRGGMGFGDLKLMAGVGAWLGPWITLHVLIVSGLATGCYSLGILLLNANSDVRTASVVNHADKLSESHLSGTQIHNCSTELVNVLSREDRRYHAIPFGAMVALGVMVAVIWVV